MTDPNVTPAAARDALVATMRTAYRDNKMLGIDTGTDTPARVAMYVTDTLLVVLADAVLAAGWRLPGDSECSDTTHVFPFGQSREPQVCHCMKVLAYADGSRWVSDADGVLVPWPEEAARDVPYGKVRRRPQEWHPSTLAATMPLDPDDDD